jgi:hypothetical protein
MGWLAPYSDLWHVTVHMWRQGFLPGAILPHHARVGGGALLGDMQPQSWMLVEVLTAWVLVS